MNDNASWAEQSNANAVKFAHEILRTLIIIHGGATIAMLGFVGTVLGNGSLAANGTAILAKPLMCFGWGLVITLGAMVAAYFTEGFVTLHAQADNRQDEEKWACRKIVMHCLAATLTFMSVGAFLLGMYQLEAAMELAFKPTNKELTPPVTKQAPATSASPLEH